MNSYAEPFVIERAMNLCMSAHAGQIDRDGRPHAMHCCRVANEQTTPARVVLGFIHDIIEDCGNQWETNIQNDFGMEMLEKARLLTRNQDENPKGESYMHYIQRVATDVDCVYVKLADIRDNTDVRRTDYKARENCSMYGKAYDYLISVLQVRGQPPPEGVLGRSTVENQGVLLV